MALTNTELANKLDTVVVGWQGFVDEQISWITGSGTVVVTDPYTQITYNIKTPAQMEADYDALLGPTGSALADAQQAVLDANTLLVNAQALDTIYQGYVTASQAAQTASEAARDAAQIAETDAETAETGAQLAETNAGVSETNAAASAAAASTDASTANSERVLAQTARTGAETAETNAAASASAASTSETNAAASVAPFTFPGSDVLLATGRFGIGAAPVAAELEISGVNPEICLLDTGVPGNETTIDCGEFVGKLTRKELSGNALLALEPLALDGIGMAQIRMFRDTNTTGQKTLRMYAGDATNDLSTQIGVDGATSFIRDGVLGVGRDNPVAQLDVLQASGNLGIQLKDDTETDGVTVTAKTNGYTSKTTGAWTRVAHAASQTLITLSDVPARGMVQIVGGNGDGQHYGVALYDLAFDGAVIIQWNTGSISSPVVSPASFGSNAILIDVDGGALRIKNDVAGPMGVHIFGV